MNFATTLVIVLATLAAFSCKRDAASPDSSLQSLDNLAAGQRETINTCGIDLDEARYEALSASTRAKLERRIEAPSAALHRTVAGVLAAVPKPLQETFFAVGGRIVVSSDPETLCRAARLSQSEQDFVLEGTSEITSCWRRIAKGVEIVLPADPAIIKHGLLRLFAYVYTQHVAAGLRHAGAASDDVDLRRALQKTVTRFEKQRSRLASVFLDELKQEREIAAHRRLRELDLADATAFENLVFAEALDSYYCSEESRHNFAEAFRTTKDHFAVGGDDGEALADDLGRAFFE